MHLYSKAYEGVVKNSSQHYNTSHWPVVRYASENHQKLRFLSHDTCFYQCTGVRKSVIKQSCNSHTAILDGTHFTPLLLSRYVSWTYKLLSCTWETTILVSFNPLNAELKPICHLLALLGAHHIFHVSGLRVKGENLWIIFTLLSLLSLDVSTTLRRCFSCRDCVVSNELWRGSYRRIIWTKLFRVCKVRPSHFNGRAEENNKHFHSRYPPSQCTYSLLSPPKLLSNGYQVYCHKKRTFFLGSKNNVELNK